MALCHGDILLSFYYQYIMTCTLLLIIRTFVCSHAVLQAENGSIFSFRVLA